MTKHIGYMSTFFYFNISVSYKYGKLWEVIDYGLCKEERPHYFMLCNWNFIDKILIKASFFKYLEQPQSGKQST